MSSVNFWSQAFLVWISDLWFLFRLSSSFCWFQSIHCWWNSWWNLNWGLVNLWGYKVMSSRLLLFANLACISIKHLSNNWLIDWWLVTLSTIIRLWWDISISDLIKVLSLCSWLLEFRISSLSSNSSIETFFWRFIEVFCWKHRSTHHASHIKVSLASTSFNLCLFMKDILNHIIYKDSEHFEIFIRWSLG